MEESLKCRVVRFKRFKSLFLCCPRNNQVKDRAWRESEKKGSWTTKFDGKLEKGVTVKTSAGRTGVRTKRWAKWILLVAQV